MKPIGSGNGYDIASPNRIQTQLCGRDLTAGERASIEARFWPKVNKADGCWLWTGSVTGGGGMQHGQFTLPRRPDRTQPHIYAHRLSWELAYGPIPNGLQVCHKCDVPRCVRPEHLFLGTQFDNLADARRKGRLNNRLPRTRKLTLADRLAIFHMPNRRGIVVELAIRYGVTKTCISLTRRGRFTGAPFQRITAGAQRRHLLGQRQQQLPNAYGFDHA